MDYYYAAHRISSSHVVGFQYARLLDADLPAGKQDAPLSIWRLGLALLCPISIVFLSWHLHLDIARKIVVSVSRTIIQLLLAGYVLLSFIFSMNSPVYVLMYLTIMMLIAAVEATSRQVRTYPGHFYDSLWAVVLGGGLIGAFGAIVIFNPDPWWNPHVMVPTAGMIIGNSISGPAVAVDRLLSEVADKKHESETRLALGATRTEAILPAMKAAVLAALIPNLNMMSVVGLVSIPGMMTGQLLGGATPLVAAEYQMAILWLICATTSISTYVAATLAMTHAAFDNEHRLTTDKITKRTEGKVATEVALYQSIKSLILSMISLFYQISHAWNTGTMTSLLSIYQTNGSASDVAGSQMGSVKKRGREQGRGPVDYNMLPGSTHGLMDEGEIYGNGIVENEDENENENENGIENGSDDKFKIKNGSRNESKSENGSMSVDDDDEVTINLSPSKSPMHALNGKSTTLSSSPSSSSIDIIDSGKTSYSFLPNTPTAHTDIENTAPSSEIFFKAEGINVLCGESNLFSSDGLMLQLRRGERMSVEGPSGLGKTRLLRAIAQLDKPVGGSMSIIENPASTDPGSLLNIPNWRRRVIYVPQALPPLTGSPKDLVNEACLYGVRASRALSVKTIQDLDKLCSDMEGSMGLAQGKLSASWSSLSGGERQRAAIGCALIVAATAAGSSSESEPRGQPNVLLLLDEPTAACDSDACACVERAVIASGLAVLIITHDKTQAERFVHKRLILNLL